MIDGLIIQPLKQIPDERGKVMHMLRADSELFTRFGEVYFSLVKPGAVKAWKRHLRMTQHIAVPVGSINLVLYAGSKGLKNIPIIEAVVIGEDNYCLVKIPPMIWYGFKGISSVPALIVNCTDMPHDPAEIERMDAFDSGIPYVWED